MNDCEMPIMNGYETVQKIKEKIDFSDKFYNVKVIAHTSYQGEEENKCKDYGFDGYLIRPSTEAAF